MCAAYCLFPQRCWAEMLGLPPHIPYFTLPLRTCQYQDGYRQITWPDGELRPPRELLRMMGTKP